MRCVGERRLQWETRRKPESEEKYREVRRELCGKGAMESCFPPLAGLSLRDNSNSASKAYKNQRHSTSNALSVASTATHPTHNSETITPKLEVLQDLDLYYIRQIASSLKVIKFILWCRICRALARRMGVEWARPKNGRKNYGRANGWGKKRDYARNSVPSGNEESEGNRKRARKNSFE